jgi:hypothetical protein
MADAHTKVSNHEALESLYGQWPSFEDAELVSLSFDRGNTLAAMQSGDWSHHIPASCTATFIVTDSRFQRGSPEAKESVVQIRLEELLSVTVSGFNHQNPLLKLSVSSEHSPQLRREILVFRWGEAALSCNTEISCVSASVVSVKLHTTA